MDNLVVLIAFGSFYGGMLWGYYLRNKLEIKTREEWYELGYKHGKQRGDADAFFEEVYQKHKD